MLASAMHDDIAASRRTALRLAEQVHEALMAPFSVDGMTYNIGGSIGITLFPKAADCVDGLLREADTAMYYAKANRGGAHIAFFETTMYLDAERRLSMEWFNKSAAQPFKVKAALRPDELLGKAVGTFVSRKIL